MPELTEDNIMLYLYRRNEQSPRHSSTINNMMMFFGSTMGELLELLRELYLDGYVRTFMAYWILTLEGEKEVERINKNV